MMRTVRRPAPSPLLPTQVAANKRRSALLVTGLVILVLLFVAALGAAVSRPAPAALVAAVLAAAAGASAWWSSGPVALALSRARPADPAGHPRLHNLVEGLCVAAGLPKPDVRVID